MLPVIDPMSGRPHFRQLADLLRDRILSGELAPGDVLPTQATLAAEHDLSVTTIREAIDVLRSEGLVESVRGKGVFVRTRPPVRKHSSARYADQLARLDAGEPPGESAFAIDHGVTLADITYDCDFGETEAPAFVAELFGIEPGALVFARHMVMRVKGRAEQIRQSWHPLDLVGGTPMTDPTRQPWPGGVIAELAELGVKITAVDEDIRARMPLPDEAYVLRIYGGVPVFVVTRVGHADHRVVEVAEMVLPADRIELHYRLDL